MTKNKFKELLNKRIQMLEYTERDRILAFYEETIDDSIEDGLSEEEAVQTLGNIDCIVNDILSEHEIVIQTKHDQKLFGLSKKWFYILAAIGSPIWLGLAVTALLLIISFYILIGCGFIFIGCLWIAPIAVAAACMIVIPFQIFQNFPYTLLISGIMLICIGLCILLSLKTKQWMRWLMSISAAFTQLIIQRFPIKEAM